MIILLRDATLCDSEFFFELRTCPQYAQFFYSNHPITFQHHSHWYQSRINSPDHIYLVAQLNSNDIGLVRFEPLSYPVIFEIGFIIHPDYIGKGLSFHMLTKAIFLLNSKIGCHKPLVFASVLQSNLPSLNALFKVGFRMASADESNLYRSHQALAPASILLCCQC